MKILMADGMVEVVQSLGRLDLHILCLLISFFGTLSRREYTPGQW